MTYLFAFFNTAGFTSFSPMVCSLPCFAIKYATLSDAVRLSMSMSTKPKTGRIAFSSNLALFILNSVSVVLEQIKSKLNQELGKIRSILLENGYPERVINSAFKRKLQQINSNPVHTVKKCPVYLHIPWIGNVSMRFEKQITSAVKRCFFSVEPRVIFNTRQLLPAIKKDVLPSHHHSNVIYQFLCHCDSRYVGRTSQRLEERIKQHVPKSITNPRTLANRQSLSHSCKNNIRPQQFHESAIGQHLLDNDQCALHYSNEKFSILARGRSSFHLSALEATFIKSLNPLLCKQKEFVYSLKIS